MMLSLTDLRYLLHLVQHDYWEATQFQRSLRVEALIADLIRTEKERTKGGETMGKTSKAAKKKSASKPTGKATKK